MTRVRVLVGCLLVLVPVLGVAPPAAAVDQDVATCVVSGQLANTPLQPIPGPMSFGGYMLLDCVTVGTGDDGGQWFLPFEGSAWLESCAAGTGSGWIKSGATSQFDGAVWGGGFSYLHAGLTAKVEGYLYTNNDGSRAHTFTAELAIVPYSPACPSNGSSSLTGAANIVDGVSGPSINAGAGACPADGMEIYPAWPLDPTPGIRPVRLDLRLNCLGVGPANGFWGMILDGSAVSSCAGEAGTASVVNSSTPIGSVSGAVNWVRVGVYMKIDGVVSGSGYTAAFSGVVGWTGLPNCLTYTYMAPFSGAAAMAVA